MKLFRLLAALGAVLFVGRRVMHRVAGEFMGMAHPGGFLTRARVQNGRFERGARRDEFDASAWYSAQEVDAEAIVEQATPAGDEDPARTRDGQRSA